jgi:hypothetical protein
MNAQPDTPKPRESLQQVFDEQFNGHQVAGHDEAFTRWQAKPTPERLRGVLTTLQPVIDQAVAQYAGQHASPTVSQRARLLAAKAVQGWQPTGGANLKTHVFRQLQAIQRLAPSVSDPFAPSERFRQHQNEIHNATNIAQTQLGREPTDEELATATGLPLKRVIRVRTRMRARLPASAYEEPDEEFETKPDIIGGERTDADDWADAVYHDLGERDRMIFMHRTGYRGAEKLSNQQLAQRLGVSPGLVSQRAARIQRRLDELHGG